MLLQEFKGMEEVQEDIQSEKEPRHRTANKLITIAMTETLERLELTEEIITTVKMEFSRLVLNLMQVFLIQWRLPGPEMERHERKKVAESKGSS